MVIIHLAALLGLHISKMAVVSMYWIFLDDVYGIFSYYSSSSCSHTCFHFNSHRCWFNPCVSSHTACYTSPCNRAPHLSRSHSHLRCGLLKWIPAGSGRWWWGVLWSKDIFLTRPFPTSSEHIHCSSAKSVNVFPSSCPCFEALHLPLPSIHLSAYPTGFTTQMLQQSDGWNICGAFLFRPRCPPLQRAAGVD